MRFYDVDGGAICIRRTHVLREFSREDVRFAFGMVLQDIGCITLPCARTSLRPTRCDRCRSRGRRESRVRRSFHSNAA